MGNDDGPDAQAAHSTVARAPGRLRPRSNILPILFADELHAGIRPLTAVKPEERGDTQISLSPESERPLGNTLQVEPIPILDRPRLEVSTPPMSFDSMPHEAPVFVSLSGFEPLVDLSPAAPPRGPIRPDVPDGAAPQTAPAPRVESLGTAVSQGQAGAGEESPKSSAGSPSLLSSPPAPTAANDSYTVVHDRHLFVNGSGVLANDTDPTGKPLLVELVSGPSNGVIDGYQIGGFSTGNGGFQYTPNAFFVGTDSFTYRATNGEQTSATATVTINVTNAGPTAVNDVYNTIEDHRLQVGKALQGSGGGPIEFGPMSFGSESGPTPAAPYLVASDKTLLANDADGDDDTLRTILVSKTTNGILDFGDGGDFWYTPDPNFHGTDTFQYYATDGIVHSPTRTVTIHVAEDTSLDLDGRDLATDTPWMGEREERFAGLGVGPGYPAEIMAWEPQAPDSEPGWSLQSRAILYDAKIVSVGGGSQNGRVDLALSGDIELSVVALKNSLEVSPDDPGRGIGTLYYEAWWQNALTGMGATSLVMLQMGPKVSISKIDFLTGHTQMFENTQTAAVKEGTAIPQYGEIEWLKDHKMDPFTCTKGTEVTAKVYLEPVALPAGVTATLQIGGGALTWVNESPGGKKHTFDPAGGKQILTASLGKLPHAIEKIALDLTWTARIQPVAGGAESIVKTAEANVPEERSLRTNGSLYSIFGTPYPDETGMPTPFRMDIAIGPMGQAFTAASQNTFNREGKVATGKPLPERVTPQQVIFEFVRINVYSPRNAVIGDKEKAQKEALVWTVPTYWTTPFPKKKDATDTKGTDCISSSSFGSEAACITGLNGGKVSHKEFTFESQTNLKVAILFPGGNTPPPSYVKDGKAVKDQYLSLWDGFYPNRFESCIVLGEGKGSYLFPITKRTPLMYQDENHVLTVFESVRVVKDIGVDETPILVEDIPPLTTSERAPSLNPYS